MKVGEVTADQLISVTITKNDTSATLMSEPAFTVGEDLYVQPFRYNGAIISFDAPDINISMMALKEDSVPFFWQIVHIRKVVKDGQFYHCISCNMDGVRLNRRNAFRVFVGVNGDCIIMQNNKTIPVNVRDISATGIGILASEEYATDFGFGSKIRIFFNDEDMYFKVDVIARVVRTVAAEKAFIYGCEFTCMYPQLERYIASKQLKLKKEKRSGAK